MALQPFFSITPSNPFVYTYDAANPRAPYALASLSSFGGVTSGGSPLRLGDQKTNDEIILGHDPMPPAYQTMGLLRSNIYGKCSIKISFYGIHVTTANQYLLLFALRSIRASVFAQFFVGTDFVRMDQLSGDEQVAILIDTLPPRRGRGVYTHIYVRLASLDYWAAMGFQGMECYLL